MKPAPGHLEAAVKRHRAGDLDGAETLYRKVLDGAPENADALNLWGLIAHQRGEYGSAIGRIQRALAAAPDNAGFHANLGLSLHAAGRLEEAEASLNRALERQPGDPAIEFKLGNVLADLKLYGAAAQAYRRALDAEPRRLGAALNLAAALREARRFDEAAEAYRGALLLDAENPGALAGLGAALGMLGRNDEALESLDAALAAELGPSEAEAARLQRATVLMALGRTADGVAAMHDALADALDYAERIARIARRHLEQGAHDWAMALLDPLIEDRCPSPEIAWVFALVAPLFARDDEAIDHANRLLQQEGRIDEERRWLHFSLARLYDKKGAYSEAFAHFETANTLFDIRYDRQEIEGFRDASVTTFSRDYMARKLKPNNDSQVPVFVVGMPRSGTTLVEQILSSHPHVHAAGELTAIHEIAASLPSVLETEKPYPHCMTELTDAKAALVARGYLTKLEDMGAGALRVTDKMPHNFRYLGLISILFPGARIIHCVRDPLDCCFFNFAQEFVAENLPYSTDLADIGHHHRAYQDLMRHWRAVVDLPLLDVHYEDIVAEQEEISRQLVAFCGLPWDDACLRFYENPRRARTASFDQVRRPMYAASVGRSRHYRAHLGPLIAALQGDGA